MTATSATTDQTNLAKDSPNTRVCVDGKFLARGGQRLRICGVTYGPFAPGSDGQPFPTTKRTADDFALMQAAGINAIRTYHAPPDWLLELAALFMTSSTLASSGRIPGYPPGNLFEKYATDT